MCLKAEDFSLVILWLHTRQRVAQLALPPQQEQPLLYAVSWGHYHSLTGHGENNVRAVRTQPQRSLSIATLTHNRFDLKYMCPIMAYLAVIIRRWGQIS